MITLQRLFTSSIFGTPIFAGPVCATVLFAALCFGFLTPSTADAQIATPTPWDTIEGNARWRVEELDVRAPAGPPTLWRQRRQALGVSTQSLSFPQRSLSDAHALIEQFADEELLGWEIALIAANSRPDLIPPPIAADWVRLLQQWPELSDTQRVQQHLSLRLRILGTGLAMAAPACLAGTLEAAEQIVTLAAIEDSIPGRRLRSRTEAPPQLPREALLHALDGVDRASVIAAIALVAFTSPATPVLGEYGLEQALEQPHCALRVARWHAAMLVRGPEEGPALLQELEQLTTQAPASERWLWRFAVHRYLMGDVATTEGIARYFGVHYARDREGLRYIMLLADLANGELSESESARPNVRSGSNPTYRWVSAEAARVAGETELAEKALSELMDMDVHFVAGWLSLAASRSRMGRGREVQLALDALLEIAPPLPMYDYWVQTLSSRRQP